MVSFTFRPLYHRDLFNKGSFVVAWNVIPLVLLSVYLKYTNRNIQNVEKFLTKYARKVYVVHWKVLHLLKMINFFSPKMLHGLSWDWIRTLSVRVRRTTNCLRHGMAHTPTHVHVNTHTHAHAHTHTHTRNGDDTLPKYLLFLSELNVTWILSKKF